MKRLSSTLLSCLLLCACGDSNPGPSKPGTQVERGPRAIPLEGDPNGLFWDAASATLYIADDQNHRLLKYRDGEGVSVAATLPDAPADSTNLGEVVRLQDGTLVTVRFGFGTAGAVLFVRPDGTPGTVPGLPMNRRRIGLTVTKDGRLLDSYFVRNNNVNVGSVAQVSLDGTETELVGALQKPVGVLAVEDTLYIADQIAGKVYRSPLSNPSALSTLATITEPDLLALGPGGALLTGTRQGTVLRISTTDGTTSALATGFQQVRGLAYDAANRRLFAADHDRDESNGTTHFLQIIPVD
ncbi:hypothetical protein MYSTI_00164 [Myxococcus stipitatus DSM 14675]|uniref:Lipoprotein n=1 Tax=Myxococcus stipitatus (strain DSM 14675 / JCM 12634 / Mx s8) TaxID=1278073 RepID=L7TZX0_MYXSD|nr:hypothetical protein [Myxococcus stipitatus]AGC41523.1 hypothetical protein MYSTI_00164 [Myxococcus stipitatus DSM 14675]